jgi:diaminopimelate decarboxylase
MTELPETLEALRGVLPARSASSGGHLVVGGCDVTTLAERFGTPLVILDRSTFEGRAAALASIIEPDRVFYAGKAFLCIAICELLADMGLGLDVCSAGELVTAVRAGFPPERVIFHGSNKSLEELRLAGETGVGRVVADSQEEMRRLEKASLETRLLVRVTPGVEAHTHDFVRTGQEDSKFGFTLASGIALEAVRRALDAPGCELVGLHAHIGSQIFELAAFDLAIRRLAEFALRCRQHTGWAPEELNLGGGLGIAHTGKETSPEPSEWLKRALEAVEREFSIRRLPTPQVAVEPGRSVVGPAAVTLYEIGTIKHVPGVRTYVSVDGGMSDNIRPALYGARYEAFLANRMSAPPGPRVTVAGKHCESGDVLVESVHLPSDVEAGDLLCVPATGAYTYAMASNYNRVPRPAVVMVEGGRAVEIVRRETYDDVLSLDQRLESTARPGTRRG